MKYKFGRGRALPYQDQFSMTPDALDNYYQGGGRFRSRPGAPLSPQDARRGPLGVVGAPGGGLSPEANWRSFFGARENIDPLTGRSTQPWGLHGKEAQPPRPVPDIQSPIKTNPNGLMADTHPGWAEGARGRTSYEDPFLNQLANGPLADSPDNPSILGQPDPSAALPAPAPVAPDLSTPQGLVDSATQNSLQYLNRSGAPIPAPIPGTVKPGTSLVTRYGSASVDTPDFYVSS